MKKRPRPFWVLCGAMLVVFFLYGAFLFLARSPYPDFQKEVKSYAALKKTFRDSDTVFLPEEDLPWDADAGYHLELDSRDYGAKPIGYYYGGTLLHGTNKVSYSITCSPEKLYDTNAQYRGIPIYADVFPETQENPDRDSHVSFTLGEHAYRLYAYYDTSIIPAEEIPNLDEETQSQLLSIAHEIIDQYLDNSDASQH